MPNLSELMIHIHYPVRGLKLYKAFLSAEKGGITVTLDSHPLPRKGTETGNSPPDIC